jgi:hypothetical protein
MADGFNFFVCKIAVSKNETGGARLKKPATPPGIVQRM